jgi:ABC-type bacteriocin/lantibiotic exporter with double-glycine peptidase domain
MPDASLSLLLSVTVCSALLALTAFLMTLAHLYLLKHLRDALSRLDLTLQLCASALHKIAGDNSTETSLAQRQLQSRTLGADARS